MKTKKFLALLVLLCICLPVLAQTKPAPPPPPQKPSDDKEDDVVKITTNLVQVDAVVTKDGKVVPNLTADDFEIFEDGRKQTITSFAYISNVPNSAPANTGREKGATAVPSSTFKRDEPHRTIAFVIDDLGLSFESMGQVRRQLRKFVAEQLQPNDLIAVIRTGGEFGTLQQFTTDKRILNRAVDQLRWNPCSRVGVYLFTPQGLPGPGGCSFGSYKNTIRSLQSIVDSMGYLPGRKSLVLLSDSVPRESQDEILAERGILKEEGLVKDESSPLDSRTTRHDALLNKIAEKAIRSSVVIYSVDTQGLATTGITAADSFRGSGLQVGQQIQDRIAMRSFLIHMRREGAELLARQTGGFQVRNSNYFELDRIMEDQTGYYLLGYRPSEETFNRRFHHIKAKVKRSGMTLRTRYGFFGMTEEEVSRRQLTQRDLTNLALASPFVAQDIELELTPFFADHQGDTSLVRSFVNLGLKDLTFSKVNGQHQASVELHSVIFGDNGAVVEQLKRGATLKFSDSEYQDVLHNGFGLSIDTPVKRPGSYQVRVAIRDRNSSKIGSAGGFVLVPNLKNKQLATSGILLGSAPESSSEPVNAGVRRFKANSDLHFGYKIYNSAVDGGSRLRNIVTEIKLFRDGKTVFSSPETPVVAGDPQDLNRVVVRGMVTLSPNLEPGSYYLQVVITEKGSKRKAEPVVQWIDFDIVK